MVEIWWRDRLLDVVPALADVPDGLTVRARALGNVERVRREGRDTDWRFFKVLAIALLMFVASALVMTLTPVSGAGEGDDLFQRAMVTHVVLPPEPPKPVKVAQRIKETGATRELFSKAPAQGNQKAKAAALLAMWDSVLSKVGGHNNAVDVALEKLTGGGGTVDAIGFVPGGGGPKGGGGGPGAGGPGLGFAGPGGGFGGPKSGGPIGSGLSAKKGSGPESGPIQITDGLHRDVVARVIRSHASEIKYCYERELQHTPELEGKVTISFTIGPTGEVIEAQIAEATMANSAVEECMLSRVKRWKFPEPLGGGVVAVSHPWIFRGAGDNHP